MANQTYNEHDARLFQQALELPCQEWPRGFELMEQCGTEEYRKLIKDHIARLNHLDEASIGML